jgi:membrane protein
MPLCPGEAWSLSKRAFQGWSQDNASSMGAALAFYTLFSLAPLLLVAIAIAGIFVGRHEAQDVLMVQLTQLMGERAAQGVGTLLDAFSARNLGFLPAAIGTLTVVVGATTVFAELHRDLNRIWRVPTQKASGAWEFVRTRLLSFGMVVVVGFLLMVSLAASAFVAALGSYWFAGSESIIHTLEFASSSLLVMLLFAMIYKLLPDTRIAWRDVWVGAAVTSLLFWLGKVAIGTYIGKAAFASAFGAAGTLVAVIAWVYYSAQVFFLGAEFTREFALRHGSRQGERHLHEERRRSDAPAANDADMVDRARRIVEVTSTP